MQTEVFDGEEKKKSQKSFTKKIRSETINSEVELFKRSEVHKSYSKTKIVTKVINNTMILYLLHIMKGTLR